MITDRWCSAYLVQNNGDLAQKNGGRNVCKHYKGYKNAIKAAYPQLLLDPTKFGMYTYCHAQRKG